MGSGLTGDDLDRIKDEAHERGGAPTIWALVAEVRRLQTMLADCYRATGQDPDGNEDWRLAEHAVAEVVSAMKFADEELNEVTRELFERDAEVDRLRDGIRSLHVPRDEEVERFHAEGSWPGELPGDCPDADEDYDILGCPGHIETVRVCRECGHDDYGDSVLFRSWPCPTVALLDDQEDTDG